MRPLSTTSAFLPIGCLLACQALPAGSERQPLEDAWWTGPLMAAPAAAMPHGHLVEETYLFDSIVQARYDDSGNRRDVPRTDNYVALAYFAYGLTDQFTLGLISRFGYQRLSQGLSSSSAGVGDTTVQAQLQIAQWRAEQRLPTISLVLSETLPTGRYDQLGERPGDGLGAGTYTTTLGLNSQRPFWLPTGRILRCRFNFAYSMAAPADIRDASVYGTGTGFRGQAQPGDTIEVTLGTEYSVARHWALAMDVNYLHGASNTLVGTYPQAPPLQPITVADKSSASSLLRLAPAIEYNWNSAVGIIAGVIVPVAGRNTSATFTPAIALNLAF